MPSRRRVLSNGYGKTPGQSLQGASYSEGYIRYPHGFFTGHIRYPHGFKVRYNRGVKTPPCKKKLKKFAYMQFL